MGLTKKQMLERSILPPVKVDAPEFGGDGHVWIKHLSVRERELWEALAGFHEEHGHEALVKKYGSFRAYACALGLCDSDGKRLFSEEDSVELANSQAVDAIDRLADEILALNRLDPESLRESKKNSKATRNGSS